MSVDTARYLRRIGVEASAPSVSALNTLVQAHLEQIPFENLEIAELHRSPSLEPEDLFQKIIVQRRGGYCFELNKLFYLLLLELGYDCYCVAARVVYHLPDPRMLSHRAIIVRLGGVSWFCDVGFGGPGPKGILAMDKPGEQRLRGDSYVFEHQGNLYRLLIKEKGVMEKVLVFQDAPYEEQDFDLLHRYYSSHPNSVFTKKRVLYRCVPGGVLSMNDSTLCFSHGSVSETTVLESGAEVAAAISERFGLNWYKENWPVF